MRKGKLPSRIVPLYRSKGSERPATFGMSTQDGVPFVGMIDHQGNIWTVTTRPKVTGVSSNPGIGLQASVSTGQFGSDRGQVDYLMARYIGGAAPTVQTLQLKDTTGGVIVSFPMLAPVKGVDEIIMPLPQIISGTHVAQLFTIEFAAPPAADEYQMVYLEAHDPGIG